LWIEFDDHVGHLVDDPDIVLRIHAHLIGEHEAVAVLADLADESSVAIELEQLRAAMGEIARSSERNEGMAGARVDENVAARIGGDAAHFTEVNVIGRLQKIDISVEGDFRRGILGYGRIAGEDRPRQQQG
jgi:hypothetical protein